MKRELRGILALVAATAACIVGCASNQAAFSARFPDNRQDDADRLFAAMQGSSQGARQAIVVGVTSDPGGLFAYDLGTHRVVWQQATALSGSPILAGELVVVQDGDLVVGRHLSNGQTAFSVPNEGMRLVGAAGTGTDCVVVLSSGSGSFARSRVIYMSAGRQLWQHQFPFQAGGPAISGQVALIPWGNQFLTGLARDSGQEMARLRVGDGVLAQVLSLRGQNFVGSDQGIALLEKQLARGRVRTVGYLKAPDAPLPGQPTFLRNVYRKDEVLGPDSAQHRIQLVWSPKADRSGRVTLANKALYLVFYRFVVALDYPTLALRWVHTHSVDFVGARAADGGVILADEDGGFAWLRATDGAVVEQDGGDRRVTAAVFPWEVHWPHGQFDEPATPAALRQQLFAAAKDTDSRLVPARRFAVRALSALTSPEATAHLLTLCDADNTAPAVRQDACQALASRTAGQGSLLDALKRHHNFLTGKAAPPVGALAKAAQQQKTPEAFDDLVAHLWDPHTRSSDLTAVLQALQAIAPQRAGTHIAAFARAYHADGVDEHVVKTVKAALTLLATRGDAEALSTLERISEDKLSIRGVRELAREMLSEFQRAEAVAAQTTQEQAVEPVAPPTQPARPPRLTVRLLNDTLLPVRKQMRACLTSAGHNLFRARVVVVVDNHVPSLISVNPKSLQACLEPLVRSQPFPKTDTSTRQQLTYVLTRR